MNAYTYIIYSEKLDKFYIGSTSFTPEQRVDQHNKGLYSNAFSQRGIPWSLFFFLECPSMKTARQIETHIKKMKSKTYIFNLIKYDEISLKLLKKYA